MVWWVVGAYNKHVGLKHTVEGLLVCGKIPQNRLPLGKGSQPGHKQQYENKASSQWRYGLYVELLADFTRRRKFHCFDESERERESNTQETRT